MEVIDDKLYLHGGYGYSSAAPKGDLWLHEPATNKWSQLATGPTLGYHASWVWNGRLYVHAGRYDGAGNKTNALWYYTPATNTWTYVSTAGGVATLGRRAAVLEDKAYIYGGGDNAGPQTYDLKTGVWSTFAAGHRVSGHSLLSYNSSLFLYGGIDLNTAAYTSRLERYDLSTNLWATLAANPLPPVRGNHAYTLVGDNIYIHGGQASSTLNDFWVYSIPSATWEQLNKAPSIRAQHALAYVKGKIYLYSGTPDGGNSIGDFWSYTI